MSLSTDLKCWEITQCGNESCPARSEPETPCWEIAKRLNNFQCVQNICTDCIVYLSKQGLFDFKKRAYRTSMRRKGFST